MKHLFILIALAITTTFVTPCEAKDNYTDLKNRYITSAERKALKKSVLPANHPIKPALDAIFMTSRATANTESILNAGFEILKNQPRSFILVVRHASMPGYLIKLHLDNDGRKKHGIEGWKWFAKRIKGANDIAKCIAKNNIQHFKVPKKWVYPLPELPSPTEVKGRRKNFILIVEDMKLLSRTDNHFAWYNHATPQLLDELKLILKKCGGGSMRASNIPFSKDGKVAFIDTEYPRAKPIYSQISPYLNPEMLKYWESITK